MMKKKKTRANSKIMTIFSVVVVVLFFAYQNAIKDKEILNLDQNVTVEEQVYKTKPFENIYLEAKSAYVFDIKNNKVIFEKNSDSQLPLASLTKLMTVLVAKEVLYDQQMVNIPVEAILQDGDSGLLVGENWDMFDLLRAMLVSSSNDAAFAVASVGDVFEFVQYMNQKSQELNLRQTYFLNPTGLDEFNNLAGAYGSAKDVASLMEYAVKKYPSVFEYTGYEFMFINSREFKNTNRLIDKIPGIIAGKTGYSDLAGGNLVIIVNVGLGYPVSIVVLGSSEDGRFQDVKKLYEETLDWLQYDP